MKCYTTNLQRGGKTLEEQVLTNDGIPVIVVTCTSFVEQYGKDLLVIPSLNSYALCAFFLKRVRLN